MAVTVKTVGALLLGLPKGSDVLEADGLTIDEALQALVRKHGEVLAEDLYKDGRIRTQLAFLLNGRNVLGLPGKFETRLESGDELIVATLLAGG